MASEFQAVETIVQAGAVGVSVLMVWLVWQLTKMYQKTLNNHLQHLDDTLNKFRTEMSEANAQHVAMAKIAEKTTVVLDRSNQVLEKMMDRYL